MQTQLKKWSTPLAVSAILSALVISPTFANPPLRVLLTSFDPFGGSSANNTQPIVAELKSQASTLGPILEVETCDLPVIYDQASSQAMQCVSRFHPDVVVSFGEADCEIDIETAASNRDDTPGAPDNAGIERTGNEVVPGGPSRIGFHFPVQAMYCALDRKSTPVKPSIDPGAFVCNNTAYHLGHDMAAMNIPFAFIHVPNSQCHSGGNPSPNARTIAGMLKAALSQIRVSGYPGPMPSDREEALSFLVELSQKNAPSCETRFAQQLVNLYR